MKCQKNDNCCEENKRGKCNKKSALDWIISNWIYKGLIFRDLNSKRCHAKIWGKSILAERATNAKILK